MTDGVIPAQAGIRGAARTGWMPACAGTTPSHHEGVSLTHRREVLRLLCAVPAWLASGAARAETGRVQWTDVQLLDGRVLSAKTLQDNAVVVLIWASWCPFCGAQNPHMQKLYDAYRGRGLTVLAFSIDRTEQAARDYLAQRGYTFNVAMHTPQVDRWFGARRTLPETYVVDRRGEVVFTHRGEMFAEDIAALARFAAQ
jgi:thiol-disulfide isomerase/thioredoxin